MTLVRFYILPDAHRSARERFACRLVARGFKAGLKTYLNMADENACREIDELLWTFSDQSFIPHEICTGSGRPECAVGIGHGCEPAADYSILINMADDVPHFFSRFEKAFEIIDDREETKVAGRSRYAFYKDRGYPLENHPM